MSRSYTGLKRIYVRTVTSLVKHVPISSAVISSMPRAILIWDTKTCSGSSCKDVLDYLPAALHPEAETSKAHLVETELSNVSLFCYV